MAAFPAALGEPDFAGHSTKSRSAVTRTQMEGFIKQAKRYSKRYIEHNLTYTWTTVQRDTFLTFFNTTLNLGSDTYTYTDPIDSVAKTANIINGEYQLRAVGSNKTHWIVSFTIETLE